MQKSVARQIMPQPSASSSLAPSELLLGTSPAWVRRGSQTDLEIREQDAQLRSDETVSDETDEMIEPASSEEDLAGSFEREHSHPFSLQPAEGSAQPSLSILPPSSPPTPTFLRHKPELRAPDVSSPSIRRSKDGIPTLQLPASPRGQSPTSPSFLAAQGGKAGLSWLTEESISILPEKLLLVSLRMESGDQCLRSMLQLTFFSTGNFFAVTQTEDEISLIVEKKSLSLFPSEIVDVCPGCWRAIQVYEGAEAIDCSGLIAMLSGAITQAGINVIYLSTFNTDLILVEEQRLDEAYASLKKTLRTLSAASAGGKAVSQRSPLDTRGDDVAMVLSPFPKRLSLVCMTRELLKVYTHTILKLLLSTAPFFSLTILNENEVVLILDEDHAGELFQTGDSRITIHPSRWRGIQVDLGSVELGMSAVKILSDILAEEQISIYYLSTYTTDFILVEDSAVEQAMAQVNKHLNVQKRGGED